MNHPWSVWLEPCEKDKIQLQPLISKYCGQYNSPFFDPHITLFGRVEINPSSTFSVFENIVKNFDSISLKVMGAKTGKPPWKSLYLQVEKTGILVQLQKEIDRFFNGYRPYEFDPHLSLAYGNHEIINSHLDDIYFPETITFSSVALVRTPNEITDWKTINHFRLGGGVSP